MDATRSDPGFVAEIVRAAIRAGATTINVPDTVGAIFPDALRAQLVELRDAVPELENVVLSFHGQDDLGLATANALAAISAGARQVELAVNGIGERAGNTSFEEVVAALHVHGRALGVHCDVDLSGLCDLSALVAARSGIAVPPNKAVVGRNAFRHASGIHQDGVLKHRETYEVLDPAVIGHATGTEIVLGKLSGRGGFVRRAADLGFELAGDPLEAAFAAFQRVAERVGEVGDEAVCEICARVLGREGAGQGGAVPTPGFALDL
jgi:2-isopropylmalate synthase